MSILATISELLGTSEPALRLLLTILAGYPLALVYRKYVAHQRANLQHLFCMLSGFLLGFWNYGFEIFHAVSAIMATFAILATIGGSLASVLLIFTYNMIYLLAGYYYAGTDNYDINWTMPQCVLVLRLVATAFDMYDGRNANLHTKQRQQSMLTEGCPNLLEFFGHSMFPASFLVGPQFNMRRYKDFIVGQYRKYPGSERAALNRFVMGLMYLAIYQLLSYVVTDEYILSTEFAESCFLRRMVLLGLWGRYSLYKYICCWLLTEGCCILFGVAYSGQDSEGNPLWNGVENIKLSIFENTTEFTQYIQSFNVNTNQWVAQYIYKRLKFLNNRYISQLGALSFLAVWHGFHSGYYLCFLFEFIVVYMERDMKNLIASNSTLRQYFDTIETNQLLRYGKKFVLRLYTFVFMGWCLLPFGLLKFQKYWLAYGAVNYIGIILFCLWPILYAPLLRFFYKKNIQNDRRNIVSEKKEN